MANIMKDKTMRYLPVFRDLKGRTVSIISDSTSQDMAIAKLRMIAKTPAHICVFCPSPSSAFQQHIIDANASLFKRYPVSDDFIENALVYFALENKTQHTNHAMRMARLAKKHGAWVNIVDCPNDSDFITPAIVDRAPIVVAIGSEGQAPAFVRSIKHVIENALPIHTSALASIAGSLRNQIKTLIPAFHLRRKFWQQFFNRFLLKHHLHASYDVQTFDNKHATKAAFKKQILSNASAFNSYNSNSAITRQNVNQSTTRDDSANVSIDPTLNTHKASLYLIDNPQINPQDLTMRARHILEQGDMIIYDKTIAQSILDLARKEACFINSSHMPAFANAILEDYASKINTRTLNPLYIWLRSSPHTIASSYCNGTLATLTRHLDIVQLIQPPAPMAITPTNSFSHPIGANATIKQSHHTNKTANISTNDIQNNAQKQLQSKAIA